MTKILCYQIDCVHCDLTKTTTPDTGICSKEYISIIGIEAECSEKLIIEED